MYTTRRQTLHCRTFSCLLYLRQELKDKERDTTWMQRDNALKGNAMNKKIATFRANVRLARHLWGEPSKITLQLLRHLSRGYLFSVAAGDLQFLEGKLYVTLCGLLRIAARRHCHGIKTVLLERLSDTG